MLFLDAQDSEKDIYLYINSPGGSVTAGMAIYDTMNFVKADVQTIVMGMAASMGSFLLTAGTKGKRFALPNAEIMIHQPLGGAQGQATEIEIAARHILQTRERLNKILAERTGQPLEVIEKDTDRDNYMTAEQAKAYGLIDKLICFKGSFFKLSYLNQIKKDGQLKLTILFYFMDATAYLCSLNFPCACIRPIST